MSKLPSGLKVTLLVPMTDNDGNSFPLRTWNWWNKELGGLVTGFTDVGMVTGWWRGVTDQNRVFVIIVRSLQEMYSIRGLLVRASREFRQEAMYLEHHRVFFEDES